jgi:MFS family permease
MTDYRNYAASSFNNVAGLSTLAVVGNITFAVFKPPIAKLSTVIGRGESYVFCVSCYLLGYILCASAESFGAYAGGFIFANIGQ